MAAPAVDVAGDGARRRRFGVAIYSRLPVISSRVARVALARGQGQGIDAAHRGRGDSATRHSGPLRVTTTHLEYYSEVAAQCPGHAASRAERRGERSRGAPRRAHRRKAAPSMRPPQAKSAILTGDFNCKTDSVGLWRDPARQHPYRDAWTIANPGKRARAHLLRARPPLLEAALLLRLHLRERRPRGARAQQCRSIQATQDSDHQPVLSARRSRGIPMSRHLQARRAPLRLHRGPLAPRPSGARGAARGHVGHEVRRHADRPRPGTVHADCS